MQHPNVCAGVTAYYPGGGFHERINAIAGQVALVIVVNNSDSDSLSRDDFAENVEIRFNKNIGAVAGALNIVLREARHLKFDYFSRSSGPNNRIDRRQSRHRRADRGP
jgi:hypothetical protein